MKSLLQSNITCTKYGETSTISTGSLVLLKKDTPVVPYSAKSNPYLYNMASMSSPMMMKEDVLFWNLNTFS